MAVLQDTAEFQIVPSDPILSRTHSRPQYPRDPSSHTSSYVASPNDHAAMQDESKMTTVYGTPLAVGVDGSGRDSLSSSGAMSSSLPTPGDVATSPSAGDKRELALSSARMKRREGRKSKIRGPSREVKQRPSLETNVKEGDLPAHSVQETGDRAVVVGGGEMVHEGVKSDGMPLKRRSPRKQRAARREETEPLCQGEEEVDGAQSYQQSTEGDTAANHPLEQAKKLIQSVTPPHLSLAPPHLSSTLPLQSVTPPHISSAPPHPSSALPLRSVTLPPEDEPVLSVTVHQCAPLQPHASLRHPLVKVHFVDTNTGEYLLKPDRSRRVVSYYETEHQRVDYVLPTATQPCNLRTQKRPFTPVWEETLVINEAISSIITPSTVALFEVLDFVDFSSVPQWSTHADLASQVYSGWFKVAWAFLQLISNNGSSNVGQKCRLQLYCYPSDKQLNKRAESKIAGGGGSGDGPPVEQSHCKVFQVWACQDRRRYPSSLTVSLGPFKIEEGVSGEREETLRSMLPVQPEGGRATFEDLLKQSNAMPLLRSDSLADSLTTHQGRAVLPPWSRLPGQSCIVPEKAAVKLPAGDMGGTALAFSRSGRLLVVALADGGVSYPMEIISIPDGRRQLSLSGHGGIIHDLSWSCDDHVIISASSDCTARCWVLSAMPSQLYLPHPSYVYAAQFHPTLPWLAVTGGYDGVVRGWGLRIGDEPAEVESLFEVLTLAGHVNTITFGCTEDRYNSFFTGHSSGTVGEWEVQVDGGEAVNATCKEERKVQGIMGRSVSHLAMHPFGNRLLVHTKGDSTIHLLDLRISSIQHSYVGAVNVRSRLRGCLCACGAHVLAGSEDGAIHVWNTDTGKSERVLRNLPSRAPVSCIAFHPHDHMFAAVSFGAREQLLIFKH